MENAGSTARRRNTVGGLARYWLPPLAWMGMIFYLSAQSSLPGPPQPWLNTLLKKGAHFGVYAGLAFWWWRALRSAPQRLSNGTALALAFILTVLYAVSDEFHQSFTPGRQPSPWDVLVDAAGAATALGLLGRRYR